MKAKIVQVCIKLDCSECSSKNTVEFKRFLEYQVFGVTRCGKCGQETIVKLILKSKKDDVRKSKSKGGERNEKAA